MLICIFCGVLFFFFQAEDGIRDKLVTGVQTCALPILTVAMNCLVVPGLTVAEAGMIVTETGGGGGALPPPQEPRTREAARMGINNTAVRMRSPGRAGTTHVSTGNVLLSKDFTRVSSSAYARNASKAAGLVPE